MGSITLTAALSNASPNNSGVTINFTMNGNDAGSSMTNASGKATHTVNPGAGTYSFGASFAGDANNNMATALDITGYIVSKDLQAEFNIISGDITKVYGDLPFQLTTSGGSGTGTVTWNSSNTAVATVNSGGFGRLF